MSDDPVIEHLLAPPRIAPTTAIKAEITAASRALCESTQTRAGARDKAANSPV